MAITENIKNVTGRIFAPDPPGIPVNELRGVPGNVQRLLDDTAAETGKKVWRGMVHSIGSGIGKGVVIAAAIVIVGSGLGALGAAGFAAGAASGFASLFFGGAATAWLGIGALLGAIMEIRQNQSKISADVAKAEAVAFEAMRAQTQPTRSQDLPEVNFAAREMAKRDTSQQALRK